MMRRNQLGARGAAPKAGGQTVMPGNYENENKELVQFTKKNRDAPLFLLNFHLCQPECDKLKIATGLKK